MLQTISDKFRASLAKTRNKVIILSLSATVLPLILLGYINIQSSQENLLATIHDHNIGAARGIADDLSNFIQHSQGRIQLMITAYAPLTLQDRQTQETALYSMLRDMPELEKITIFDASGQDIIIVSRRDVLGISDFLEEGYEQKIHYGRVYLASDGRPILPISIPIWDQVANQSLGLIKAHVNLRSFIQNTTESDIAGYYYVVNQDGYLIGHQDFSEVLAGRDVRNSQVIDHFLARTSPYAVPHPFQYKSYTGKEVLGAYAFIPQLGWGVIIEEEIKEALKPIKQLYFRFALATFIIGISVGLLSLWAAISFTRPIEEISQAASTIAAGDFSYQIQSQASGEIGELIESFAYMTQELQIKQEMEAMVIHADRLAAIGLLASGVAHEINNPLNTINLYSEFAVSQLEDLKAKIQIMIAEGKRVDELESYILDIEKIIKDLGIVESQVARGSNITRGLLNFSRQQELVCQATDINDQLREAAGLLGHAIKQAGIKLDLDLAPDLTYIECSGSHLQQVFFNLIQNAIDAIADTGANQKKEIKISSRQLDGDNIEIKIADSGTGIPADKLARLFDPFYTTKEVGKGTGLGLSVSYGIIQELQGELLVDSQLGQGTSFTIRLPIKLI